uniref:Reduced folate carrier n=1 Tax=Globodera rostochiensis TaxID=31243 RepID=A0A914GW68_GLORO
MAARETQQLPTNWKASILPILLVFYAFLKEVKVGEPYLYKYQTDYLNLTAEQITGEIYPVTPYTYMVALIPIFLLTDLLLYKPTMFTEVLGQVGFRLTLVFGGSVLSQKFGQMFYGIASASEVAFFSYIYARLEKSQYRRLTSWTRAGTMAGRTSGYLFAQLFVFTHLGNLHTLNVIALVLPCVVLMFCVALPSVHWKTMVGRMLEAKGRVIHEHSSMSPLNVPKTYVAYVCYRLRKLGSDFLAIYRVGHIRKWSFWWAMTTCMSLQVALFSQTLWGEVQRRDTKEQNPMNGFAEAAYTFVATLAILAMNVWPLNWDKWGELALVIISTTDAVLLFLYARTDSIWTMYACYIGYRSLYQVMITIAQWNIAKKMVVESYGLVFGVNSFVALLMQSVLTIVVTDERGLGLRVRPQYNIYAIIHVLIALVFLSSVLFTFGSYWLGKREKKCTSSSTELSLKNGSKGIWNISLSSARCEKN